MHRLLFFIISFYSLSAVCQNHLQINEIMISNIDGYVVDYDFPDSWVELYNPTDQDIDIKGYTLKQQTDETETYTFTSSTIISAKGFIVICCDKEGKDIHTSFRLNADGGTLSLFDTNEQPVDSCTYPEMVAPQIGYGRIATNCHKWEWEKTATPNHENTGLFTDTILPNPIFSTKGHMMDSPETISITMPNEGLPKDTKIHITLNGEEPSDSSESATSFTFNIDKTTIIRAKLISEEAISPRSLTQSYIFHPRTTDLPIISIVTDSLHLYDNEFGLFSSNKTLNEKENFRQEWRRPINIEYLGCVGDEPLFNQLSETALSGVYSRLYAQKSMKCYTHKRFGKKKYKAQLWEDKDNVKKIKSFILRNGGNNCERDRITDGFIQRLCGTHITNLDYQAYTPVIAYINGQYNGVYGLRERCNEDYVEANYNGLEDLITSACSHYAQTDKSAREFINYCKIYEQDSTSYETMDQLIDIDNFMKTFIVECYASNYDYPHNNIFMWRPATEGGKWRWIIKDLDFMNAANNTQRFNMFKYVLGTDDRECDEYALWEKNKTAQYAFLPYRKIMSFPRFRKDFLDHFITYLGDFLKPSVSTTLANKMLDEIKTEITPTAQAFGMTELSRLNKWANNKLLSFLAARPSNIYNQMAEYFSLGQVIPMTLMTNGNDVSINDVKLTEGDFDGCYFSDRELLLNAGKENYGWKMTIHKKEAEEEPTEYFFKKSVLSLMLRDYTSCTSVSFEPIPLSDIENKETAIIQTTKASTNCIETIYSILGQKRARKHKGTNILQYTNGKGKKVYQR